MYSMVLGLYPNEFRAQFGEEMIAVFRQAATEHRKRGGAHFLTFVAKELTGLVAGAGRERVVRTNPDRECEQLAFPSDIAGAEQYLDIVSRRLIHAIANHDFANARYYDDQDRRTRALLAQLRAAS